MTHDEAFEIAKAELVSASGGKVKADVIDSEGSTLNWNCNAIASVAMELGFQDAQRHAARFLDTGQGEDLSRYAHDSYDVQRAGATSSVAAVTFTRTTTVAELTIVAGTVLRTPGGVRFALDEDVTMAIAAGSATGTVTSTQAGADQNVDADTITIFEGAAPQSDLTVTNPAGAAGGNDAETDEQLRSRVRQAFVTARRGTLEALRIGALSVDQVREAASYESLDSDGNETGHVVLIVSDADGDSNQTLQDAVDLILDDWRAAGVQVAVAGASVFSQAIDVTPTWRQGQATAANDVALRKAIVAFVNRLDPNGAPTAALAPESAKLTHGLIQAAARTIPGLVGLTVNTPSGTVAPDHGFVIRTTLAQVTTS